LVVFVLSMVSRLLSYMSLYVFGLNFLIHANLLQWFQISQQPTRLFKSFHQHLESRWKSVH
jgi:hypothetical protein